MRIAILGAGFCGLAAAWHLLSQSSLKSSDPLKITIIDGKKIGGGTSGIAAGLLHPFAGAHAKFNQFGKEGMDATQELLEVASNALQKPVYTKTGILRLALNDKQHEDFLACSSKYKDETCWLNADECQALYPTFTKAPGLWIKNGIVVQSELYLQGLWQACAEKGALYENRSIYSLDELIDFDVVVFAIGAGYLHFPELKQFSLKTVKGQILRLKWPEDLPILPCVINSQAYIIMHEDKKSCLAGATFEKNYLTEGPDEKVAKEEILPKVMPLIPQLQHAETIECLAGLRVVTPDHLPLIKNFDGNKWILTGMGSKGLLYHALYAKQLAKKIMTH